MPQWIIHLKDGRTLTDKDCYPHSVDQDLITSVERVEDGWVATILKSDLFTNFFVKRTASVDLVFGKEGAKPVRVEESIVGCFILPREDPIRLELVIASEKKRVKVRGDPVEEMGEEGAIVSSVQRIEDEIEATILASPLLQNFFVKKTTLEREALKTVDSESILGCYVLPHDKPIRLELLLIPGRKKVKLRAFSVKRLSKRGF